MCIPAPPQSRMPQGSIILHVQLLVTRSIYYKQKQSLLMSPGHSDVTRVLMLASWLESKSFIIELLAVEGGRVCWNCTLNEVWLECPFNIDLFIFCAMFSLHSQLKLHWGLTQPMHLCLKPLICSGWAYPQPKLKICHILWLKSQTKGHTDARWTDLSKHMRPVTHKSSTGKRREEEYMQSEDMLSIRFRL